jgi:glyoxylate/hydroxypyruvate reductase A
MRLLLRTSQSASDAWRNALAAALPDAEIAVWPDVPFAPDYVLAWKPSRALFDRVPAPRAIFNLGAGVDALLALPNVPRDVPVIRLEDAGMAAPMAEYVTMEVLAAHRKRDAYRRAQGRAEWIDRGGADPGAFGVGLLGLGVLGRACAAMLRHFGFRLLGWSRSPKTIDGVQTHAGTDGLGLVLRESNVLVCLLPSTADTANLLDARRLALLPRGAHVVNVARGDLIVDDDLLHALDSGHLAGATLDVFRTEPLPSTHPFWHHPAIVVTPHVSAVTRIAESAAQVVAKIRALERGDAVTGVVDRARGY